MNAIIVGNFVWSSPHLFEPHGDTWYLLDALELSKTLISVILKAKLQNIFNIHARIKDNTCCLRVEEQQQKKPHRGGSPLGPCLLVGLRAPVLVQLLMKLHNSIFFNST